ncbi:MAG: ketopantoate reductase family protein [Thermomicrobiales bacterium]
MRTVVLGAGAMGSLLAARLAEAGADVALLGRSSAHLAAMRQQGLRLEELDGTTRTVAIPATEDAAAVRGAELVVLVVKSWATAEALAPLRDELPVDTTILTLQNGLGNARAIGQAVGEGPHILTGVTTQAALRERPGFVRHTGAGLTAVGREGSQGDARAVEVAAFLSACTWPALAVVDVDRWVWRKLAINAAINPLTALAGVPNRAIADDPDLAAAAGGLAREVAAVAAELGYDLGDIVGAVMDVARATGANRSSMLCDVTDGIPTEIDAINGAVVAEAAARGISVPANCLALALVRARERAVSGSDSGGDRPLHR